MGNEIGHRIKLARKREGLSLRSLATKMGQRVSAQAIGKYERGEMVPGSQVLLALCDALNVSMNYLLAPKNTRLGSVDFRKHSRTSSKEKARVEAEVLHYAERCLELDEVRGRSGTDWEEPFRFQEVSSPEQAEALADKVRSVWTLGINPIPDVTELLEEKGLKVMVLDLPPNVSGLTCMVSRDNSRCVPVIVVNRTHSLERRRFTLLHELAHRILSVPGDEKGTEKAANRFAGALLMNRQHLVGLLGGARHSFGAREILTLKKIYRVSAAAMWYRICQIGYVTQSQYEYGCRTFARGWRGKLEPEELEDSRLRGTLELPTSLERTCHAALAEGLISLVKAAELLDKPVGQVERDLKGDRRPVKP